MVDRSEQRAVAAALGESENRRIDSLIVSGFGFGTTRYAIFWLVFFFSVCSRPPEQASSQHYVVVKERPFRSVFLAVPGAKSYMGFQGREN